MAQQIKKILYATDLSKNSAHAFDYALDFAEKNNAKIVLLHVFEDLSATTKTLIASYLTEKQVKKIFEDKKRDARERIEKRLKVLCQKKLRSEADVARLIDTIEVKEGFPAEGILQSAEAFDVDVIVMGTNSKGLIENTFLGSTAKRVLRRTHKPIYVIPLPRGNTDISIDE